MLADTFPSGWGRRTIAALTALTLLLSALPSTAAAAGGSRPTRFNTTPVYCTTDFISSNQAYIVANEPNMWTEGTRFNGYFKAYSKLQISRDEGATWRTVAGSKRNHGRTRISGSGASAFHDVSWGPWTITEPLKTYTYRVRTTFLWLNTGREVVAKKTRTADYYTTSVWTMSPGGWPVENKWFSAQACFVIR